MIVLQSEAPKFVAILTNPPVINPCYLPCRPHKELRFLALGRGWQGSGTLKTKGVDSSTQLKLNHDLNRYHQIHFNLSLPGVNSRFNPFCCWMILGGLNSDLILC